MFKTFNGSCLIVHKGWYIAVVDVRQFTALRLKMTSDIQHSIFAIIIHLSLQINIFN
jgi:hypothetical protein